MTALVSVPLVMTYSMHLIRYILIAVGFASFVFVYHNYIFYYIRKVLHKKNNH